VISILHSSPLQKGGRMCLRVVATLSVLCTAGAFTAQAATICVNPGGTSGCKTTINAALGAASAGDTILVAPGTYKEAVVITKPVALLGSWRASVIDASGLANGIFVNGMSAAPKIGISNVTVSGFTVRNANFEGILVANATDVSLTGNLVTDNDKALDIATPACTGIPAFETNEAEDCGEGIHLMATEYVSVVNNEVAWNSGGILISDETGPNHANLISGNHVHDNPYDCGITLASHGPATSVISSAKLPYGVSNNTILNNVSAHNGFQVPGAGAGVGIFAPFPGTSNTGNVVIGNELRDNGATGVAMHNHAAAPSPGPPVNLNDNVVIGNHFSGNGPDNPGAPTSGPTGINVYSMAPVWGTVISQNDFDQEAIDVAFNVPSGQMNVHLNEFNGKAIGVEELSTATTTTTATIDATENWWNCPLGPGATPGCATASGTGVTTSPWLTSPGNLSTPPDVDRFRRRW
jgi:nitrous oxidase accessory protein NosD